MRRPPAPDLALAAAVFAATLAMVGAGGFGTAEADAHGLDAGGVVLTALASLPVALRRIAPLPAFAVAGAASTALIALAFGLDLPFGVMVLAYDVAVAHAGSADRLRRAAAIATVSAFPVAAAVAIGLRGYDLTELLVPEMLGWGLLFAGLWVTGDRTQLRAARFADLRARAERAERDAARERRLAAAEERTRIARELHDSAGHAINVILVQAGAARLLHEQDPARSREALTTIEAVARDTIGEIDRLVRALREDDAPPADPAAVEALVDHHRASGLRVAADVRGARRDIPRSVAWAAYRIVQESLTNAARHGAGEADLHVRFGDHEVQIDVRNPAVAHGTDADGGHGIVGMRERATLLGGTLDAGGDGATFRVRARLPYGEAAA